MEILTGRAKAFTGVVTAILLLIAGFGYWHFSVLSTICVALLGGGAYILAVRQTPRFTMTSIFAILLGLFWVASTYGYDRTPDVGWLIGLICAVVGLSLLFTAVLLFFDQLQLSQATSDHRAHLFFGYSFAAMVLVWGFYLVSLWPGTFTYDSYTQWGEANGYIALSNWHPLLHTLLLGLFSKIQYSQAPFLVAQILFGAFTVSFVLMRMLKRGLPFWLANVVVAVYALYPINGVHMVTVWKDIPYSIVLLLMFYLTAEIVRTNGANLNRWPSVIGYSAVLFGTALLRKNGFYVVLVVIVYLLLFKHTQKVLIACIVGLVGIFGFNGVMNHVYHAAQSPTTEALGVPIQQVAATYRAGGHFPAAQRRYFAKIMPASQWKRRYNPYLVDTIKFAPAFRGAIIDDHPKQFLVNWFKLFLNNKQTFIKSYLLQSAFLWKYVTPPNDPVSLMESPLRHQIQPKDVSVYQLYRLYQRDPKAAEPQIRVNYERQVALKRGNHQALQTYAQYKAAFLRANKAVAPRSLFPAGKAFLQQIFTFVQTKAQRQLASGPLALLVILFALALALLRFRFWNTVGMFLVPALNFLSFAVAAPASSFRYVYSWFFSAIFIFLYVLVQAHHTQRDSDTTDHLNDKAES